MSPTNDSPENARGLAALPRANNAAWARYLWALPMLLSLLFVGSTIVWLLRIDALDREERRQTMIADALTLETQLRGQLEAESAQLGEIAKQIQTGKLSTTQFATSAVVTNSFTSLWRSVTWLDQSNRVLAFASIGNTNASLSQADSPTGQRGLSAHLVANLSGSAVGSLVARYSPTVLLKHSVPWWLARKYHVRLIDTLEQEIAAMDSSMPRSVGGKLGAGLGLERASYRLSFDPTIRDAYLELIEHEPFVPWTRSFLPTFIIVFLLLITIATWMLRRQMRSVLHAESAWRTESAWRSAMEDSMVVGLRARDFDGRLVYVNRTFAEMVGWPVESLIGKLPPMPYWQPDEIEKTMQRHRRNMAGDAPREGYEARWLHGRGHSFDVMVFETPLVDASGKQIGWMGSILDITERKRMEERDRKQADTLAHHARLTMLGEVASTLAHELNQPLTAIASYNAGVINSLQRDGFSDASVHNALLRLGEQAAQAGRIVARIREFLTRREPELEPCNIHEVVVNAIALFRRELTRHQITIKFNNDNHAIQVLADAVLIEQVMINLLRNATDAFSAAPDQMRLIEVSVHPAGEAFLRIDVTDNGPGLGGRAIRDLCAAFYSTKTEGMGMGLAICRSIIEAHGGALDAAESPASFAPHGAQFSLTLPAFKPTRSTGLQDSDTDNIDIDMDVDSDKVAVTQHEVEA